VSRYRFEEDSVCSSEDIPIEHSVLNGFFDVLRLDLGRGLKVGDGSSHTDYFVVSAGREA
jgi:hypothetical protein